MKRIKRCETCMHGLLAGEDADRHVVCTLIPPAPIVTVRNGQAIIDWLRPKMILSGWCGQHKLSWLRWLFGHGAGA